MDARHWEPPDSTWALYLGAPIRAHIFDDQVGNATANTRQALFLATYYLGPGSRPCPCPVLSWTARILSCSPTCGFPVLENKALSLFGYNSRHLPLSLSVSVSVSVPLHPVKVSLFFPSCGCNLICRKVWTVNLINIRSTGHQASVDARVSFIDPNAGPCISLALADPASSFGPFNDPRNPFKIQNFQINSIADLACSQLTFGAA